MACSRVSEDSLVLLRMTFETLIRHAQACASEKQAHQDSQGPCLKTRLQAFDLRLLQNVHCLTCFNHLYATRLWLRGTGSAAPLPSDSLHPSRQVPTPAFLRLTKGASVKPSSFSWLA